MRARLACLSLLLLVASPAGARPVSAGFVIASKRAEAVSARERYDLLDLRSRGFLALRPGRDGDELTTRDKPLGAVQLVKQEGGELRCGDAFGVKVDGAWLVQGDALPLSLVTTKRQSAEVFQWRVGNCKGTGPVMTNAPIALANTKANDALVGCRRPWGPPFCWDEKQAMGTPAP